MASMWMFKITNISGSAQEIEDCGITIEDSTAEITLSDFFSFTELACSDDLRTLISNGDFIANDGLKDLTAQEGVDFLTLENIEHLEENYYSISEMQNPGAALVHWDNITNTPAFGSLSWLDPVEYRVLDISSTAPGGPSNGDVYVNTGNNHYYKYDGTWLDEGVASSGDRVVNLADGQEDIYTFGDSAWTVSDSTSTEGVAIIVNDDGDGKSAQYIYDLNTLSWRKIGDVDFTGHFDGGASKHDASEVDVEGTYSNIAGTPTDLETTISAIDTSLGTALDHNTLDEAYDQGGAGVGRIINADSGPVKIDRGSSIDASLEIVPKTALPSANLADGQIENKANASGGVILCVYDTVRSKWLSVARPTIAFGRSGTTQNQYLAFYGGNMYSNNAGIRVPRDATIVSLSGQLDAVGTCIFRLGKNDVTLIADLSLSEVIGLSDTTVNVDVSTGDFLQCLLKSSTGVEDPFIFIELAWRL